MWPLALFRRSAHAAEEADPQAVLDMLIPHARELLAAQVQDVDELASKALGVLAVDGVVLAVVVGARDDLSWFWLLPAAVS